MSEGVPAAPFAPLFAVSTTRVKVTDDVLTQAAMLDSPLPSAFGMVPEGASKDIS
jgi:hypothetical protein